MKKQTAVEWLIEQIFNDVDLKDKILKLAINQAKKMENEQIIESYKQGRNDQLEKDSIYINNLIDKIYNETFES